MNNKKKIIIMGCLVALLAVTAVFNFVLSGTQTSYASGDEVTASNYFTSYRSERTSTRSEELLQLDSVIALYDETDEKFQEAADTKLKIVAMMENELSIETMIKSLGFSDAVVSIGYDSENVNVFINSDELSYDSALSIYNMLKNEKGIASGNIVIMPVYSAS